MSDTQVSIPLVGEVIAGKYRLTRLLGEGGMGSVLEAEHLKLRQPIAIKFLNPTLLGVEEIVQRFEREARAAATLRSRHVVRVTDVEVTPEGVPYMVMELLVGGDLEVERERRKHIPFDEAVNYVLQACGALAEAHDAGIVHRDLKPGNLFLAREDGDRVVVKVLDFGISKFLKGEDAKLTSAGAIMGTALYMSPEQIRGDDSINARSDIWSLGVILYELISGNAPWSGPTTRVAAAIVSESIPELRAPTPVPEGLVHAIYRMLEKSPGNRFSSIAEVAQVLAPYARTGTIGLEVADQLARRSQRALENVLGNGGGVSFGGGGASLSNPTELAAPSSPMMTIPMMSAPGSDPAMAASVPPGAVITPRAGANPERSTMAATTTNANMKGALLSSRSRGAIWGVFAGFGTLAIAGVILIVVVARSKSTTTTTQPTIAAVVTTDPSAAVSAAVTPAVSASAAPTPLVASASATPSSSARAPAPTATTKKTGLGGLGATTPPSPTPPPKPPAPPPTPAAKTSDAPVINPPFLK